MIYYRATTADLCSPILGGPPIWDGSLPHTLPRVENACARLEDAIRLAGEWPAGRPSRLWRVVPVEDCPILHRGDKSRAASWTIQDEVSPEEARAARRRLYAPLAGDGLSVEDLVAEVEAWRAALARPGRDAAAVEAGLRAALDARGLAAWTLCRYDCASAARDARAASAAWDDWDDWAARDALTVWVSARRGWTCQQRPDLLTVGLREAYAAGLEVALPTGSTELGWALEDQTRAPGADPAGVTP